MIIMHAILFLPFANHSSSRNFVIPFCVCASKIIMTKPSSMQNCDEVLLLLAEGEGEGDDDGDDAVDSTEQSLI